MMSLNFTHCEDQVAVPQMGKIFNRHIIPWRNDYKMRTTPDSIR